MATQFVSLALRQGGPSTAVNLNAAPVDFAALFSSMSLSTISPVRRSEVVVVDAMTWSPWSQQSYRLLQPPWVRQVSPAGTTMRQARVRNSTRLWFAPL